jgi:hypothetical protein
MRAEGGGRGRKLRTRANKNERTRARSIVDLISAVCISGIVGGGKEVGLGRWLKEE